jgi:hypothetical protein
MKQISGETTPNSALSARDGESALRDKLPGERAHAIRQ